MARYRVFKNGDVCITNSRWWSGYKFVMTKRKDNSFSFGASFGAIGSRSRSAIDSDQCGELIVIIIDNKMIRDSNGERYLCMITSDGSLDLIICYEHELEKVEM